MTMLRTVDFLPLLEVKYFIHRLWEILVTGRCIMITMRFQKMIHDLEDRVDKYLHKMGVVQARELVVKSENPPISGRIDFIVKHPKEGLAIVELKSIHDSGWSALIDKPKPEHFVQIQLYMNMQGIDYGIVLYEDKNDQTYKAFKMTVDRQFWADIKTRCNRIMAMNAPPVNCTGERYCRCGGKRA